MVKKGIAYIKANGNKTYRVDDETGKILGIVDLSNVHTGTVLASTLVPGQDGNLYVFTWNNGLWRLNREGKPTLIDFGASRAAMVGRTTALTAIFTPGYAAAEQMTSAKQGPWTDIYGLSATLYHAITGHAPPSAFDRASSAALSRMPPAHHT